jgi:hypothetical protein
MPHRYHVKSIALGDLHIAEQLISDYRFKPFYFVHSVKNEKLNTLATRRIQRFLSTPKNEAFGLTDKEGKLVALAGVEPLEWDSEILGVICGRIPFFMLSGDNEDQARQGRALLTELLGYARSLDIEMLSIRTSAHDFGLIHPLEDTGFRIMDNGMTAIYHKSVLFDYLKKGLILRHYQDGDLPDILELIAGAYEDDRFHNDPRIPYEKAEAIYSNWISKSCTNPGPDEHVLVGEYEGKVNGFFQYQLLHDFSEATGIHVHSCGLAAVKRGREGLGIYHSLLSRAIKIFIEEGSPYGMTRIPFSIQPILKLTLRLGPSFLVNDLTFHLWLD